MTWQQPWTTRDNAAAVALVLLIIEAAVTSILIMVMCQLQEAGTKLFSNACPRCGWFVHNLSAWPDWDGHLATPSGRAIFRQRIWCEVVVIVRASSKALMFPYFLLQLGHRYNLPSTLSAFFAFSYLIPWVVENAKTADAMINPAQFRRDRRRNRPRPVAPTDDADCGAAPQAEHLATITQSQALQNIMAGGCTVVYLQKGESCSVCLEEFTPEAVQVAFSGKPVYDICADLVKLAPPIVALRCGHPLHVECAEAAVAAGGARHVRCPMCREPVTLGGATSARLFN